MRDATQIIVRPLLTEKSVELQRLNKFTFEVARDATKIEIQKAIETLGECRRDLPGGDIVSGVEKVNTLVIKGKLRRTRRGHARTAAWKKAIVTLKDGWTLGGLLGEAFETG
jgi:large subunit ribosomal protein L23